MARILTEFYCATVGGGCGGYFKVFLRTNMYGNYTIQCPKDGCNHHHFRFIDAGVVTNDRHSERGGQAEVIVGLKATYSPTPSHNDPDYRRSTFELLQGANP
jgi:hypothetical protein